jgi:hypothetical protein
MQRVRRLAQRTRFFACAHAADGTGGMSCPLPPATVSAMPGQIMPTELKEPSDPTLLEAKWWPCAWAIADTLIFATAMWGGIQARRHLPAAAELVVYLVLLMLVLSWLLVLALCYQAWWGSAKQEHFSKRMAVGCFTVFLCFGGSASTLFNVIGVLSR